MGLQEAQMTKLRAQPKPKRWGPGYTENRRSGKKGERKNREKSASAAAAAAHECEERPESLVESSSFLETLAWVLPPGARSCDFLQICEDRHRSIHLLQDSGTFASDFQGLLFFDRWFSQSLFFSCVLDLLCFTPFFFGFSFNDVWSSGFEVTIVVLFFYFF